MTRVLGNDVQYY